MFAWASLLRIALHNLRLTPAQFWALTPFEFGVMIGLGAANGTLNRNGLQDLMNRFPDKTSG